MFNEERKNEIDNQRKGLSLACLFTKPRPMWIDPVFVATFGDAFIERTQLEGMSSLARSFTVLNLVTNRLLEQPLLVRAVDVLDSAEAGVVVEDGLDEDGDVKKRGGGGEGVRQELAADDLFLRLGCGFGSRSRAILSDCIHVFRQSEAVFKLNTKVKNESTLLTYLKKLKGYIASIGIGESLLLPAYVENFELAFLLERTKERVFRVVVIQTQWSAGLNYHAVTAALKMPHVHFRTCMVFNDVSKKNVLDDVFWMALYNMQIHEHKGDMAKLYDVLLPFLTGKPLESHLVEAEKFAAETEVTAAVKTEESGIPVGSSIPERFGVWRNSQRSKTAYVRLYLEAMHFILRRRGMRELKAKQVSERVI